MLIYHIIATNKKLTPITKSDNIIIKSENKDGFDL